MNETLQHNTEVDTIRRVTYGDTTMQDAREIIKAELNSRGMTSYAIGKLCQEHGMSRAQVNEFLKGERDINWANLMVMFDCMGLEVVKRKTRQSRHARRTKPAKR